MWFGDLNSAQMFNWLSQQSDYNCPIMCKCPINDLIGGGGGGGQSDSWKLQYPYKYNPLPGSSAQYLR